MKRTRLEDFRRELLETGSYRTHADCRAPRRAKKGSLTTFRLAWPVGSLFHMTALHRALGILNHDRWDRTCFKTVTAAESLGMDVVFEGWENRAAVKGPVVYVCNHMSSLDAPLLSAALRSYGPFVIVAKASLLKLPFLDTELTDLMEMVGIERKSPRDDLKRMLRIGEEKIRQGTSFWVFPEGSRFKVFDRAHFSSLGAKVAEHAECPICPVALDMRCLPIREKGLFRGILHDFGTADPSADVRCVCGPIIPCGRSREMNEVAFSWLAGKLAEWGLPVAGI